MPFEVKVLIVPPLPAHRACCPSLPPQVPFLGWVPVRPVQQLLQAVAVPTAGLLFQRTGTQFFLADGALPQPQPPAGTSNSSTTTTAATNSSTATTIPQRPAMAMQRPSATSLAAAAVALSAPGGAGAALREATEAAAAPAALAVPSPQGSPPPSPVSSAPSPSPSPSPSPAAPPLLYRMTQDDPDRGLYFYSALASFASRTAYANTGTGVGVRDQGSATSLAYESQVWTYCCRSGVHNAS